jgi:hypothetical protein
MGTGAGRAYSSESVKHACVADLGGSVPTKSAVGSTRLSHYCQKEPYKVSLLLEAAWCMAAGQSSSSSLLAPASAASESGVCPCTQTSSQTWEGSLHMSIVLSYSFLPTQRYLNSACNSRMHMKHAMPCPWPTQ